MRYRLTFVLVMGLGCASLSAQEQPDLAKENAQLKAQLAEAKKPAPPTLPQVQEAYAKAFKEAKEKAEPGCKALKGSLSITETDGKLSVTCKF